MVKGTKLRYLSHIWLYGGLKWSKCNLPLKHSDQGRADFEGRCNYSMTSAKTLLLEKSDRHDPKQ